ncbi:methyltransferase FkbM family [Caldicellulosiruptor kronotskyensis 2002]|uniref:Methyltransferase FkbM family n=1 Tax=Caldicellulosiruptor kronotskyensis (strain DSM 18902 / VKM B-2412 / 2002) TaxID=632348 RepID=E4SCJ2_CALK2|nr:FkbM family methyltransferase [Caldicellulosiruptor kronotskyensis]ADQ45926.1 methyltransferase FkbM family [Caldicellulosiruptor kronotskyensis 2002]
MKVVKNNSFQSKIKDLIMSYNNSEYGNRFFNEIISSDIFIYGAGNAGRMTYELLQKLNLDIVGFMDRKASVIEKCMNKPVYNVDDESINKERAFIIVAFRCSYDELKSVILWLNNLGYKKICYYHEIYNYIITKGLSENKLNGINDVLKLCQEKIFEVASYLSDKRSQELFYNFIEAVLCSNWNKFSKSDTDLQYFVNNIMFKKGYSRFVDCGAYDGDTAYMLNKVVGQFDKIALFEPDMDNFKKLSDKIKKYPIAKEHFLFPCGVWRETALVRFSAGKQSISAISEDGNVYIQCVALDDILIDFAPTFIKMDIEGAEYEALIGAESIIKKYSPDLAISVYHKIEHIWEIPYLIKKINPNYKLYLRTHGLYGMETVLYATC